MTLTDKANYVKLTHANFKGPVWVSKANIFAFYFSKTHQCTHIVGPATSLIPVIETEEDVLKLLEQKETKHVGQT